MDYPTIFYHIYPLGLLGAPKINTSNLESEERLEELVPWLNHIQDLGCNALYLGPVFESSTHGYDTSDYYKVDRRLGTNVSLRALIGKAHELGIKVILDAVFNHVGRDFWGFKDVQLYGQGSKYIDWFSQLDFKKTSPLGDSFTYDTWNGHYQLVKLNLKNPEVKKHLFGAVHQWINEYQIDGLRLDAADVIDFSFLAELSEYSKKLKPDFWLMGEVVQGDYKEWINKGKLDSVTNYDYHTPFYESFNQANFGKIAAVLEQQNVEKKVSQPMNLYSFVDNHDVDRAASMLNKPEHLYPLYLLLFTLPGIPAIYYGSEWGFEGKKRAGSDDALRPKVNFDNRGEHAKHPPLIDAIKKFIAIRKTNAALSHGAYRELMFTKEQFVFARTYQNREVIVIINASRNRETLEIYLLKVGQMWYRDILNIGFQCSSKDRRYPLKCPLVGDVF